MEQPNHVHTLYTELKAAHKTHARKMALFTINIGVWVVGFFFSLAQFFLMLTLQCLLTLHFIISDSASTKHQHLDYSKFTET